jgi:hypothetical protein
MVLEQLVLQLIFFFSHSIYNSQALFIFYAYIEFVSNNFKSLDPSVLAVFLFCIEGNVEIIVNLNDEKPINASHEDFIPFYLQFLNSALIFKNC